MASHPPPPPARPPSSGAGGRLSTLRAALRRTGPGRGLLLAVLVLLSLGALRLTAPVTLPLAFAIFLVVVFWPLEQRLRRWMPRGLAVASVFLAFLLTMGALAGTIYLTVLLVGREAPAYAAVVADRLATVRAWAVDQGLLLPGAGRLSSPGLVGLLRDALLGVSGGTLSFLGAFGLMVAFFFFALFEVSTLDLKLARALPGRDPHRWLEPFLNIAHAMLRYMVVRTGIGLATGLVVGVATWALGVDLVPVWAVSTFLLNYIPIIGSIVAVFPPAIFEAVQTGSLGAAALVLAVLSAIQFTIGNYLDPLIQGHYLSLSPLVVLLSIALWGWVWGVVGAFIGVPITVAILLACDQFDRTRWIAVLLADTPRRPRAR